MSKPPSQNSNTTRHERPTHRPALLSLRATLLLLISGLAGLGAGALSFAADHSWPTAVEAAAAAAAGTLALLNQLVE